MELTQLSGQCDSHIHYLADGTGIHKAMQAPWLSLLHAAQNDGIEIKIASGYRSFERQAAIWNRKFSGQLCINDINNQAVNIEGLSDLEKINAILLYSALPGASRHHWGTDIDVYSPSLLPKTQKLQLEPWEYGSEGYFYSLHTWLQKHAKTFGFYRPYQRYQGGVAEEPWHLSYQPLSCEYAKTLTLSKLEQVISASDILGKNTILDNLPHFYSQYINNICEYASS